MQVLEDLMGKLEGEDAGAKALGAIFGEGVLERLKKAKEKLQEETEPTPIERNAKWKEAAAADREKQK